MLLLSPHHKNEPLWIQSNIAQQQTLPDIAVIPISMSNTSNLCVPEQSRAPLLISEPFEPQSDHMVSDESELMLEQATANDQPKHTKKQWIVRLIISAILLVAVLSLYFIWGTSSPTISPPKVSVSQQNVDHGSNSSNNSSVDNSGNSIQVYIVGAVKHPGVYLLPTNARIHQLLQQAGGPLPTANLVSLNLAAKLTDGEEIYITNVGEQPPASSGTLPASTSAGTSNSAASSVNINTASATELRQGLHISSASAQAIVNYRLQHGPYTSVDQLANVVSTAIFNRIRDMVTV